MQALTVGKLSITKKLKKCKKSLHFTFSHWMVSFQVQTLCPFVSFRQILKRFEALFSLVLWQQNLKSSVEIWLVSFSFATPLFILEMKQDVCSCTQGFKTKIVLLAELGCFCSFFQHIHCCVTQLRKNYCVRYPKRAWLMWGAEPHF